MIPARFSTGTRDTYLHARNDLPAAGQAAYFPPRAVMLHRLDAGRQIKFSELSNIEHRVRNRKIILAL
jgi:hypothetical protein